MDNVHPEASAIKGLSEIMGCYLHVRVKRGGELLLQRAHKGNGCLRDGGAR